MINEKICPDTIDNWSFVNSITLFLPPRVVTSLTYVQDGIYMLRALFATTSFTQKLLLSSSCNPTTHLLVSRKDWHVRRLLGGRVWTEEFLAVREIEKTAERQEKDLNLAAAEKVSEYEWCSADWGRNQSQREQAADAEVDLANGILARDWVNGLVKVIRCQQGSWDRRSEKGVELVRASRNVSELLII